MKIDEPISPRMILPLDSEFADLAAAGGKGTNLSRLLRAGMPVPPGFLVSVEAYHAFVGHNHLAAVIQDCLDGLEAAASTQIEGASTRIRAQFAAGSLSQPLAQALRTAYQNLGSGPVAVRSSATAEDLPDLSFAGQQDTYLNVTGEDALLQAVVSCWGSLWTARAIGYRLRNQVDHCGVALAVVVQRMVESRASGVLFTANPLTGLRGETVIDAAFGLGEALVSGLVEPDHYIVDPAAGVIRSKSLGRKALSIHGLRQGGTRAVEEDRSAVQALPDEQIIELASLGAQVAGQYGTPQDIEWAWAGDKIYLLQSRPITSLFPLPAELPADPLKVFFSFGAVQGMLEPITPLGVDALKGIFAAGASLLGYRFTAQTQTVLYTAGERLWVNFTPIASNSTGRRIIQSVFGMVEPTIGQALEEIWHDPRLLPKREGIRPAARLRLARLVIPLAGNILLNLLAPRRRRTFIIANGERILSDLTNRSAVFTGSRRDVLKARIDLFEEGMARHLSRTFLLFISSVATGMAAWNLLRLLNPDRRHPNAAKDDAWNQLVLEVTRGMPHNPTTEMDLALWDVARAFRADPCASDILNRTGSKQLSELYLAGQLPPQIQTRLAAFLRIYGGRGLGEIDMGRTRWIDDPTHVFEMLSSFMHIDDFGSAPDAVFSKGALAAKNAIAEMDRRARAGRMGWLRAALVRFLAGRARQWMGTRENPKFFAVRMMALIQRALLRSGAEYVASGDLDRPDDLVFLTLDEILAFAAGEILDWRSLIASRRQAYEREKRRGQIPRLLLSDGRAFFGGMRSSGPNTISGSPVSPGSATGRVRVVIDPTRANLQPGEILVCPGTDPSWTPLFLSAAGLVMEVGGMMTHGAVVAREYGIPAIVGVHEATTRLKTGMLIQLNGTNGNIEMLAESTGESEKDALDQRET